MTRNFNFAVLVGVDTNNPRYINRIAEVGCIDNPINERFLDEFQCFMELLQMPIFWFISISFIKNVNKSKCMYIIHGEVHCNIRTTGRSTTKLLCQEPIKTNVGSYRIVCNEFWEYYYYY